jgi:hypothetical protein
VLFRSEDDPELGANLSAAAHLIHGSSEGRFTIHYAAPLLGREAVEKEARYAYLPYEEAMARYAPEGRTPGWHTASDGEPFYFVPNAALGLWRYDG